MCENGCSHEDKYLTITKADDLLFSCVPVVFSSKNSSSVILPSISLYAKKYVCFPSFLYLVNFMYMYVHLIIFTPHYPLLSPPTESFFPTSPLRTFMSFVLLRLWPIEFHWGCLHSMGCGLELTRGTPLKNAFPFLSIHSFSIGSSSRRDGGLILRIMECLRVCILSFHRAFLISVSVQV